jgi:hypothetical protein
LRKDGPVIAQLLSLLAATGPLPPAAVTVSRRPPARAVATEVRPIIDGRLDEGAWLTAEVLGDFVQTSPSEGSAASEATEVRVIYDSRALYLGFRCWDSQARALRPRLARRDGLSRTDWVGVALDTFHDRRNAYVFMITSAGTLADGILTEGEADTRLEWDGVWEGRVAVDGQGWSAEMEIPFSTLRFPRSAEQRWGFRLRRLVARRNEMSEWSLIRVTDSKVIGRFADLVGIAGVQPGLALQLSPFIAATGRLSFAPESLSPRNRVGGNAGLDLKYGLTGTLTLDGTINPDFGQVEVDPAVVNLTAYETFFPEKRRFFQEGSELFTVPTPPWQQGMAFVYTRRIGAPPAKPDPRSGGTVVGLDPAAQILGAAKLTGNLRPGTAVAVLAAQVAGAGALERVGEGPTASVRRLEAAPPATFSAARIRQLVGSHTAVGAAVTSVVRPGGAPEAHVLVADFDVRGDGDYTANGFAAWSATPACDPARSGRRPGERCDRLGAWLRAGKTGGDVQVYGSFEYTGAHFDINDLGFMPHLLGNQMIAPTTIAAWRRPRPLGPVAELWLEGGHSVGWNPAAGEPAGHAGLLHNIVFHQGNARFVPGNWRLGWSFETQLSSYFDDIETRGNRNVPLLRRPRRREGSLSLRSDETRPFSAGLQAWGSSNGEDRDGGIRLDGSVQLSRLQVALGGSGSRVRNRLRGLGDAPDGFPLVARLDLDQIDVDLRASGSITRDFTVQLYGQVLHASERYLGEGLLQSPTTVTPCAPPEGPVPAACGPRGTRGSNDRTRTSFLLNAVLRWEYLPGSTLYLVYTRNHPLSAPSARFDPARVPRTLAAGSADNVVALKLSYLWAL